MSLVKTLNPAGVLVEVNSNVLTNPQVAEDIVDEIAALDADTASGTGLPGTPTITVAAQVTTTRAATIQLKDALGVALAEKALVSVWLSDTAAGVQTASAPAGGWAFGTGVVQAVLTANKAAAVISDATGVIVVTLTHATAAANVTWYVNVAFGSHIVSAAVNITNA